MGELFEAFGLKEESKRLKREAAALKKRFNRDFWMADKKYFALALDGDDNQVDSMTSNPGHCLWSRIIDSDKAKDVADRLMDPTLFSGWGIRTMSTQDRGYNPLSYHCGSVWPHDNSIIAKGFHNYGFKERQGLLLEGLFLASVEFKENRFPELFCGFSREETRYIVEYPVACSPQAWAAGSMFLLFQAVMGIEPEAFHNHVHVEPELPVCLRRCFREIALENMRVGDSLVFLSVEKDGFKAETIGDVEVIASWS